MKNILVSLFLLLISLSACSAPAREVVDKVWSGHHVNFALISSRTHLYAGYYDAHRQLTIAERDRAGGPWAYKKLDTFLGWDSHNYVALGLDQDDRLHVAANMHASPLIYFMSAPGGDIASLGQVDKLVARADETNVTYPVFLHDHAGRLIFEYRSGSSGNGDLIYDVFDTNTGYWSHLLNTPLIDGQGRYSPYIEGPVMGPDHDFHITWVWRDTPDASTNHDLSYAKSPDLIHWLKADGTPLALPMTFGHSEIVDPVPVRSGMINNDTVLGFDDQGRVMITYHKYAGGGNTQVFVARYEGDHWNIRQISQWRHFRWNVRGLGTIKTVLSVGGAEPAGNGLLRVPVTRHGRSSDLMIRADDLSFVEERPATVLRQDLAAQINVPDGMSVNVATDPDCACALAWTARPANRDMPYTTVTPPSDLILVSTATQ